MDKVMKEEDIFKQMHSELTIYIRRIQSNKLSIYVSPSI